MTNSSRPAASEPRKIAAIVTTFFANSHADVIVTKFARGFPTDDGLLPPQVEVASMYMDQTHANDIGQSLARDCGIPIYQSIPATLCLGGNELAVDGVLSIGEHGDYAYNEKGQRLYPRRHFLEQICGVLATSGRVVPVFSDKHLACTWSDALWVYDRARQLGRQKLPTRVYFHGVISILESECDRDEDLAWGGPVRPAASEIRSAGPRPAGGSGFPLIRKHLNEK